MLGEYILNDTVGGHKAVSFGDDLIPDFSNCTSFEFVSLSILYKISININP